MHRKFEILFFQFRMHRVPETMCTESVTIQNRWWSSCSQGVSSDGIQYNVEIHYSPYQLRNFHFPQALIGFERGDRLFWVCSGALISENFVPVSVLTISKLKRFVELNRTSSFFLNSAIWPNTFRGFGFQSWRWWCWRWWCWSTLV